MTSVTGVSSNGGTPHHKNPVFGTTGILPPRVATGILPMNFNGQFSSVLKDCLKELFKSGEIDMEVLVDVTNAYSGGHWLEVKVRLTIDGEVVAERDASDSLPGCMC